MKTEITSFSSSFFEYLCGFVWFDQDKLEALMKRYTVGTIKMGDRLACLVSTYLVPSPARRLHW